MIVDKRNKCAIERFDKPNENWTGDNKNYYLVDSNSELAKKIIENSPFFDFITDELENLIDITPIDKPIYDTVESKISELSDSCTQTIYNGIDVKLTDGTIEHFTLDEQDQLNLSGIGLKLLMGAETVAWHKDDETEPCRFYSAADAQKIISNLTIFKEYHITYFRDLRIYVRSLASAEDINNITYGFEIPEEFKSDVLKQYENEILDTTNK